MRRQGQNRCRLGRWVGAALMAAWGAVAGAQSTPFALRVDTAEVASGHADVRVSVAVPEGHIIYADSFRVTAGESVSAEALHLPQAETEPDPMDKGKRLPIYAHPFESLWRVAPIQTDARLTVAYQGCSATLCFMPERHVFRFDASAGRFAAVSDGETEAVTEKTSSASVPSWSDGFSLTIGGGYMGTSAFLAFLDRAEGRAPAASRRGFAGFINDPVAFFQAHGWLLTLALVLLGGVLLNLTPCVLPMIPINLAIIGAGAGTRGRGFWLGSAYGAGMVLVYGGLGWAILKSGLFFGALQASPWFSLSVAVIFAALSLALFDVFIIDFTRFASSRGSTRQGALAAFSAGALSALLAGACVAPVVLAVLLLAGSLVAGGVREAQFLPFVLGLGMALPWPFAGAGLSVLPRPGLWMVRVKQAFGVFLALLALYYGYLAAVGFRPAREAREGSILAGDRAAWEAKVAQARREGKPLFVDFWATWCKNCSAMEKTTFANARVKARLAAYAVVHVQAEKPDQAAQKEMLDAFGVRGLPGFAVLRPSE